MKWQSYCLSMVLCLLSAATADISVSGIVKKSDGTTGIPGVKVSLSEQNDFFSFTDSSGIFKIEGTGLRSYLPKANTIKIDLKDRILYISPIALKQNCKIGSIQLPEKPSIQIAISDPATGPLSQTPHLSSGIYLIRLTLGNIELTYTLSCMGKRLF